MSISTQKGDDGTTALLFGRRVPKNHPRVEASGACDEFNAVLGVAKAAQDSRNSSGSWIKKRLHAIQQKLVDVMGELSSLPKDRSRYQAKGYRLISQEDVQELTNWVHELEAQNLKLEGWTTPGFSQASSALDVARTVCRRTERQVVNIGPEAKTDHQQILAYLNRLSDLLWLMARKLEKCDSKS